MPHFVIEFSRSLEQETTPEALMQAAHHAGMRSGLFKEADVKVRLNAVDHGLVGGKNEPQLHITAYLLSGRDLPTKKKLTGALVDALGSLVPSATSVSANAIDMDRDSYSKIMR